MAYICELAAILGQRNRKTARNKNDNLKNDKVMRKILNILVL
jgi:hypothetical protein